MVLTILKLACRGQIVKIYEERERNKAYEVLNRGEREIRHTKLLTEINKAYKV